MRFRQVHLDFHTSEAIRPIAAGFSAAQFQQMLRLGHVDSVTVFAKCHHGWAYFPSRENEIHPGLGFDLLGAQIEAAHAIGVGTPVYLSAGLDEKEARRHPEWLMREPDERLNGTPDFLHPGYHQLCLNSPYLEVLVRQTEEVVQNYAADGIFLDIVGVRTCYCRNCVAALRAQDQDPRDPEAVRALGERTYAAYTDRLNAAIHAIKPGLPIFHNGGHLRRGRRDLARKNTHLELESLPTGGWGYDHFPLSARYAATLGMDYLGMTGKFHTSWGEFGGFKHPNALRYEAALSLASGARCSVGDQLHPTGVMEEATYALIGAAYREVAQKEPWCVGTVPVADIGLLSAEAVGDDAQNADAGAVRILLEGKFLFDVIDAEAEFGRYQVLVLPDRIWLTPDLQVRLADFTAQGGKILATGASGLWAGRDEFALDLGARCLGPAPFTPDYFRPDFPLPSLGPSAFVMYGGGCRIEATGGTVLGRREESYFNRDAFHFCSHQHTPNKPGQDEPGLVETERSIYIAWNVFEDYAAKGSLVLKEMVVQALNRLLPQKSLETNLGAQGIVTLTRQESEDRYVLHLLYAAPVRRGASIEVIEDLPPVVGCRVQVRVPERVQGVCLAPQDTDLAFEKTAGGVSFEIPAFICHQMVTLSFSEPS